MPRWNTERVSRLVDGASKEPAMRTWRTRSHRELADLLIEMLNNQADQCDESADAFGWTAAAPDGCGRSVQAGQLRDAARHNRVEAIRRRAFAHAAQHQCSSNG
jgi:hypothetical protein